MKFAATFTPGMGELVTRQLKKFPVEELQLTYQEDGLIVGTTAYSPEWLRGVRFWNNAFIVLAEAKEANSVDELVPHLTKGVLQKVLPTQLPDIQTIQLRVMDSNQPVAMASQRRKIVERLLASQGLQVVRQHADIELWVMRRASNYGIIGIRLPRQRFKRQERAPGELRPELVHLMGLAAGVTGKDVVLDPFTGHGAIPRELIAGFSPKQVIAIEQNPRLVGKVRALAKDKPSFILMPGDALEMDGIGSNSVTRIVTDPPWGEYTTTSLPLEEFYERMCNEFARVLKPGGVAVVLSSAKEVLADAAEASSLEAIKSYDILVSGKKAVLLKLRKRNSLRV